MDERYEISENDVEVALRWLKINDPENATREKAVEMLHDLQSGFHGMAHNDPEQLAKLQQGLSDKKLEES